MNGCRIRNVVFLVVFSLGMENALHDAGAESLPDSDTGNRFVLPGYAIHDELQLLAEAGPTPYEAISAGTRNAAIFLEKLAGFGTVGVGKRADLILVRDNPFSDISTIGQPKGVMVRGNWLSSGENQLMLGNPAKKHQEESE